jgi:hypothetical protein
MARAHGRILSSIWEDEDFLALTEQQQRLYLFLISQPNLNHAGLLPLTLRRWARKSRGLTAAELDKHLQALTETGFIVLDDDTEELLIRSFVRNDGVWKQPKVMGAMVSGALEISSRMLRRALLAEMGRVPLDDLSDEPTKTTRGEGPSIRQQVADHIEALRKAFREPDPTPSGRASAPPSRTPSDTPPEEPREPSTRGRAGTHVRAAPALSPAPTPAPDKRGAAEADEEPEAVLAEDADFVGAAEAAPSGDQPVTAQTIVAEWLERVNKRPPGQTIGQAAKQIKALLDEGIDPDDIRSGLARWMAKGSAPSAIPSFVNEAMNAAPAKHSNVLDLNTRQPLTGTDAKVAAHAALTEQLRALEARETS